ncbi:hypothetical protein GTW43_30290, partial [Streptomyces sp. SID5785]|uniref:ABC transporter ATP-binding protein n=1 Tax=Streptomyces sp. SID5785 TaxID=2690309 RepID=UPI001360E24E|nr:hypothetical protein [Streptomyces sp. SID5785]
IVLITHDLGVVAETADRVLVMYAGRPVEQAPADDLFAAPGHPYTRGLLGAVLRPGSRTADSRARLNEIPGLVPDLRRQPDACSFAPRCAFAQDDCRDGRPLLRTLSGTHRIACHYPAGAAPEAGSAPESEAGSAPDAGPASATQAEEVSR